MTDYKYIEIGTCDFSTLMKKYPDDKGLSVEPIKKYLDNLPNYDNNTKVNVAISNTNGLVKFYKLKDEYIDNPDKVPKHDRGMSSLEIANNSTKRLQGRARKERFELVEVPAMTVEKLLSDYNITSVEHFKVDTEGFDCEIIKQLLETSLRPQHIKFEIGHSKQEDVTMIKNLLIESGYNITKEGWDLECSLVV